MAEMILKSKIRAKGSGLFFWIRVYESQKELILAYNKYAKKCGKELDNGDALGIMSPHKTYNSGSMEVMPDIGIVWLCATHLHPSILAHEIIHCALWHERVLNRCDEIEFPDVCGEAEEAFAHVHTELMDSLIRILKKRGLCNLPNYYPR